MPNIKLYTSNRLEILADRLSDLVCKPLSSPFKPEAIVVQSKGMERWISMQLAERIGVWSNCIYYFPNQIIEEIFKSIIPGFTGDRLFDKKRAVWQIIEILSGSLSIKGFEELREYLKYGEGFFRYYQLSSRIADLFDQYLTYRPDMIIDWDKGKGSGWQAGLWRLLMDKLSIQHPPAMRESFFERMESAANINFDRLPGRITVFGISSMPVYHMDILASVSDYIDVNIFFMNPSAEYWADIFTEKKIAGTLGRYESTATSKELHLEKGNSLLASMGRIGADFLSILMTSDPDQLQFFAEPGRDSLLCSIQSDILNMTDRGSSDEHKRVEFSPGNMVSDNSVMIHSCHSPMREIEVLYDNILDMFSNDTGLEPRDIIVMMPDIETYSPYISAVFGGYRKDEHKIPFSIADRSVRKDSTIDTFFAVLDLQEGRFGSAEVMEILECSDVMNKFGISPAELIIIKRWIKETNINWGIDAEYRVKNGLPGIHENTWKAGIERMLLGYTMTGSEEAMYENILPYDIEGGEAAVLGRFVEFYNSLTKTTKALERDYTLSGWSSILKEILGSLFIEGDLKSPQEIRDALYSMGELEERSGLRTPVDFRTIKAWLEGFLSEKLIKTGFLTGGVTFCAMLPMRSIPFRIICLVGMNDNDFPSAENTVSFDIMARNPMAGDRSRRNDDRYLFLESVISARKKLYISYIGQGIRDNSEIPPSVVVSELLDYISQGYGVKGANIMDYILVKHRLQSFNQRYFGGSRNLFSYSEINCEAGKAAAGERKDPLPFITEKLPDPYEINKSISVNDIIKFFAGPAAYLARARLGIYLNDGTDILDESEPFEISGLEKYYLEDYICGCYIEGRDTQNLYKKIRAAGLLPHGVTGEVYFNNIIPGIMDFSSRIKEFAGGNKLGPLKVDMNICGFNIFGTMDNIWPGGAVQYRYADTKAKDRLRSWIMHLVLNATGEEAFPMNSFLICKDALWETEQFYGTDILTVLIGIYTKGNKELIPFFPETSFEYANSIINKGSHTEALKSAERKWTGNDYITGEGNDPYYRLCFGNTNPLNKDFAGISLAVYEDMLKRQRKR